MQVTIIDVGTPNTHAAKNGRSYSSIEVTYRDETGKVGSKKLVSFSNPTVYNVVKELKKDDKVFIKLEKDSNGYWQWIGASTTPLTAVESKGESKVSSPTPVKSGTYETKEERAQRQVMIVRQSSLATAVNMLTAGSKSQPNVDSVIQVAKRFEAYVLDNDDGSLASLKDDLDEVMVA